MKSTRNENDLISVYPPRPRSPEDIQAEREAIKALQILENLVTAFIVILAASILILFISIGA